MRSLVFSLFAASLIMVFCAAAKAADESLVLFLPLDEGTGVEVKDFSPHKNDGTLEGKTPEWVEGKRGKALNFAGGIIKVPHDDSLNLAGAHTISFWGRELHGLQLSPKGLSAQSIPITIRLGLERIRYGITGLTTVRCPQRLQSHSRSGCF